MKNTHKQGKWNQRHGHKVQTDSDQGVGGDKMGERRGTVRWRNIYKGSIHMDNNVGIDYGTGAGVDRSGESNRGKVGTTVNEQQQKFF